MKVKRVKFYRKGHEAGLFGIKFADDMFIIGSRALAVFENTGEGLSETAINYLKKWIETPDPGTLILVKEIKEIST